MTFDLLVLQLFKIKGWIIFSHIMEVIRWARKIIGNANSLQLLFHADSGLTNFPVEKEYIYRQVLL